MGDDGYGSVGLSFAFPYYDKTFNQAYMYDNGIISFIEPGQQGAVSPWHWSSTPLNQTSYKYFIAPLWADIAPVPQTTYTTSGTATSQKFTWNNIAEYYSRGEILRLNTFSVEINANGDIATKYFGLNLRTSNISIGYKGDTDYTQIMYNPYGYVLSSQADWTANTKVSVAPTPVTPTVPAAAKQQQQDIIAEILQPTVTDTNTQQQQQTVVVDTSQPAQQTTVTSTPVASTSPAPATSAPTAPTAAATQTAESATKTGDTKKAAAAVKSQASVDMAVVDAAIAVAMTSASQSVNEQTVAAVQTTQSTVSLITRQNTSSQVTQRQSAEQVDYTQQSTASADKKDAMDHVILNMLEKQESRQEYKDKAMNKGVKSLADLGPEIPLFSVYSQVMLPDITFYVPKEIYKKQRVVDNARLFRSLTSDGLHEQMIQQQYQR